MKRASLLGAVALSALWHCEAAAQVTVPLPSASHPAPAPPAAPVHPQPAAPADQSLPTVGQSSVSSIPIGIHGRPDINPYERDIDMTVPLMYRNRSLGDVPVRLTFDDRFLVNTKAFLDLIKPLLNASAFPKLSSHLAGHETFSADLLASTGVALEYDPGTLSIVVLRIDPGQLAVEDLFAPPRPDRDDTNLQPASFSGFLNINAVENYYWEGQKTPPSVLLNGALRLHGIVFEGDGQFGQTIGLNDGDQSYGFIRNYARLVYDQPDQFRRWYLGDLTPEIRGEQTYVQMGGIGVVRQRRRFNDFRPAVLEGDRQFILQRSATVSIMRNGVLYRQFRLDPGSYDLSSLPLVTGSNNVQVQIKDDSGAIQTLDYQQYLDPIDLDPGDYEYGAYFGPTSNRFGETPHYNGPISFTGYYRKAFLNAPAVGVGLQASSHVQTLTGQTQVVVWNGSRILFDGGASHARDIGSGFSGGVGYEQLIDRGDEIDSFTIRADYLSKHYASLGDPLASNPSSWNFNAQYSRALNLKMTLLFDATYVHNRDREGDSYRIDASVNYYLNRRWSLRGGIAYTRLPGSFDNGNGFGFNISLVFQPNYRDRAEARYDSSVDTAQLSYTHSESERIGSVGYGGLVTKQQSSYTGQGFVDYVANRFDASLSEETYGDGFSSIGQRNVTSLSVGTSIAFANGVFGIGRRINDSFAILYPHRTLKGHSVVVGQSLAQNDYLAKSGTFGGAVDSFLGSYATQSIQYDVENAPLGYDIGPGVARVDPPYHSGYALRVGTDAFASATGTLEFANGKPVSLVAGTIVALDGKDVSSPSFFTNSVGRFAIQNLRPGTTYRVELYEPPRRFEFTVPRDTNGLVDLKILKLAPEK